MVGAEYMPPEYVRVRCREWAPALPPTSLPRLKMFSSPANRCGTAKVCDGLRIMRALDGVPGAYTALRAALVPAEGKPRQQCDGVQVDITHTHSHTRKHQFHITHPETGWAASRAPVPP